MDRRISVLAFALVVVEMIIRVSSLPAASEFTEGPCDEVPITPAVADRATMDSFKYLSGGSKFIMYSIASARPNYGEMREDEFYYDACFTRNTTTLRDSIGTIFGFGGSEVGSFYVNGNPPETYLDLLAMNSSVGPIRETITLTDHKTFLFSHVCLPQLNLRAWDIVTATPGVINPQTRKVIEEHALSLGFKRENFVFLRYDSCEKLVLPPELG